MSGPGPGPGSGPGSGSSASSLMDESALERYFEDSIANVSRNRSACSKLLQPQLYLLTLTAENWFLSGRIK